MPFIASADEWLTLSAQLLEARPTTVCVATRASLSPPPNQSLRPLLSASKLKAPRY